MDNNFLFKTLEFYAKKFNPEESESYNKHCYNLFRGDLKYSGLDVEKFDNFSLCSIINWCRARSKLPIIRYLAEQIKTSIPAKDEVIHYVNTTIEQLNYECNMDTLQNGIDPEVFELESELENNKLRL